MAGNNFVAGARRVGCRMDLAALLTLASRFAAAIKAVPPEDRPIGLRQFPTGGCADSSQMLGAYLRDHGYDGFELKYAERGIKSDQTWRTHAWLQRGILVVDLTAGQFPDAPAPVIVASPSPWHGSFHVSGEGPADFRDDRGPGLAEIAMLYERVCERL